MKFKKSIIYISSILLTATTAFAGVSLPGPSGFLNVPSPQTVSAGSFEGGFHYQSYGLGGNSNYNLTSFKANVGVSENLEVGFEKTNDSGSLLIEQGMVVTAKGGWKINDDIQVSGGVIVDTSSGNYSSIYGVFGAEMAFFGMGFNFGGDSGLMGGTAKMGGYDVSNLEADKVFFIAGAKLAFGDNGALTVSYNGDSVGLGFYAQLDEEDMKSVVEIGWLIESDYEDLYKMKLNPKYKKDRLFFGISGSW
ncbi:MAG: hypothetical protein WC337_07550 [Candidatus Muiribacteriota bacterium]